MCQIVGYVGAQAALDMVLDGLSDPQHPGASGASDASDDSGDSAGVAVVADGGLAAATTAGGLPELRQLLRRRPLPTGTTAIGHLRRATGGAPTGSGGHPQLDNAGRVAVVHDGAIANHAELRAELAARGHHFVSRTDTEVVAHLLAEAFSSCAELAEAMRQVCRALRGTFAMLAVHADEPDAVVGARRALPLCVGRGDGESALASGPSRLPGGGALDVVTLHDPGRDHVVLLRRDADEVRCEITDVEGGVVLA